jgi:hypothetical protein
VIAKRETSARGGQRRPSDMRSGRRQGVAACLAIATALLLGIAGSAGAAATWRVTSFSNPSARPSEQVQFTIVVRNVGDTAAPAATGGDASNCDSVPVRPQCYMLVTRFPTGLTPVSIPLRSFTRCTIDGGTNSVICSSPGNAQQVAPLGGEVVTVMADVAPGAAGTLTTSFDMSGAGASADTTVDPIEITSVPPEFGVADFDAQVAADAAGTAFTQAGGHPFSASTAIEFNAITDPNPFVGFLWPIEPAKTLIADLPPGFVGDPTVVDQCTTPELANTAGNIFPRSLCPTSSQVGVTVVRASAQASSLFGPIPVYSMEPPPDVPARFGFNILGSVVLLDAELRSDGDYGLSVVARNIPQAVAVQGTELTLWGVPADPIHDRERACPGESPPWERGPTCTLRGAPQKAFLRNPTMCTPDGVGLTTTLRVDSWTDPGDFVSRSFQSHLPPAYPSPPQDWGRAQGPNGCDRVPFSPSLRGTPATGSQAGKPAGFSFDLSLPQTNDPRTVGTSDLRKAVVTLPQGVRVSPSSADGLAACSSAQIGLDSRADPTCPEAAKVGSLTIETPLLRDSLEGSVYLATPFDNPFDSLIAIYLVARGPGLIVKLAGHVSPDASKGGQLTTTFDDQPQLPFSNLHLEFKGGPRAPIVLPKKCGTYTTRAEMTGWSGRTVVTESSFTVDQGCGGGFRPRMEAGTENPVAGASSTFSLRLTREDSDEEIKALSIDMPRGLTGRIADATLCGETDAKNGTCPETSRVGSVVVGAGAGTNPFYVTNGRAYITGPYTERGSPFGLSIVVPAVAGPFDLGTVVVRSAVFVDKHTAELRVVSDELPQQLQGIPLDVKDVRVLVDRAGFFLNPTSCEEKTITGVIESVAGSRANVSSRFQVGDCAALPLRPRMTLQVGGRRRTQRGRTTPFTATLRQSPGQAGLSRVQVTLPTAINARLTVINDACTRAQYEDGNCEGARTGSATAVTPLLRDPLRGGVYFVRNGNPLPDLFVRLRGQVDFDLIGRITIPGSKRLRTTFSGVPDVPVSSFTLRLDGGREGSVGNATNLCSRRGRRARATLLFEGQNGKQLQVRQRLKVRGCRARSAGRRGRNRRR